MSSVLNFGLDYFSKVIPLRSVTRSSQIGVLLLINLLIASTATERQLCQVILNLTTLT